MESYMCLILFWSGPIGLGFFLLCIGGMQYLLAKDKEVDERVKEAKKHRGDQT
jgi:hypothetical protein